MQALVGRVYIRLPVSDFVSWMTLLGTIVISVLLPLDMSQHTVSRGMSQHTVSRGMTQHTVSRGMTRCTVSRGMTRCTVSQVPVKF